MNTIPIRQSLQTEYFYLLKRRYRGLGLDV